MPDDEMLIDRLGLTDKHLLHEIWQDLLHTAHQKGELFNLLLHPERLDYFAKPLDMLLEEAANQANLWVCSLDDISRWYQTHHVLT